tara:strand:- start:805 stop:1017 length:213 start_codon:yes stop_codon:yes gene_type:complete
MANYLITVSFETDNVQIHFDGSLKDGLKQAWSLCAERKCEPVAITFQKAGEVIPHEQDGWQTISPIERMA